jgi:hypothetical protein
MAYPPVVERHAKRIRHWAGSFWRAAIIGLRNGYLGIARRARKSPRRCPNWLLSNWNNNRLCTGLAVPLSNPVNSYMAGTPAAGALSRP